MASLMNAKSWRVIDIVTAAVLAVVCGLIFLFWNAVGGSLYETLKAVTPGLGGLAVGVWLWGGVLGGLILQKPGAAVFVEFVAASVSAVLGSQWGIETVYSGLAQGLGAGLVFLIFRYRRFSLPVAMGAGAMAAVLEWALELTLFGNAAKGAYYNFIYLITMSVSGAVLAGAVCYFIVRGLAATGALDRFPSGRAAKLV